MKTIRNLFRLVVTLLLVLGWGLAASALHVVWTGGKPLVIPKDGLGVRETYVDVSNWTAEDVAQHPTVARRLVATGNAEAIAHAFEATTPAELVRQVEEAIERGPTTQPAPTLVDRVEQVVEQAKATVGQ